MTVFLKLTEPEGNTSSDLGPSFSLEQGSWFKLVYSCILYTFVILLLKAEATFTKALKGPERAIALVMPIATKEGLMEFCLRKKETNIVAIM